MSQESQETIPKRGVGDSVPVSDYLADDGFNLIDVLSPLVTRKRLVLTTVLLFGMIAAAIALLLPNMYTAAAMVVTPQKEQSSASLLLGQLGPLAAAAGADIGLKNPAELYVGILNSRTILEAVIKQFGLRELYAKETQTETIAKLKKRCSFAVGRDSLIRIEVEDVDPKRAAAMANLFVLELDAQNRRLAIGEASNRREFLEKQLKDEKTALVTAEEAMKTTQQKTGIVEVNAQTQLAIASIAQLSAQITAGEVALERLKMGATPENPAVLNAQVELAAMRGQLSRMEQSEDRGPLVATSKLAVTGLGYIRSLRELKYHEYLFEMLSKQYEAARLDESKAGPALQIVDSAVPPDKRSGPPRSLIVLFGCVLGTVTAVSVAHYQRWRQTMPPQAVNS